MVTKHAPGEGDGFPLIDLYTAEIDPTVAKVIPLTLMTRYFVLPIRREGAKLVVAMVDPTNAIAMDDMRLIVGFEIAPGRISKEQFDAYMAKTYPTENAATQEEKVSDMMQAANLFNEPGAENRVDTEDAPIIRMVNVLFQNAYKSGATVINIVPFRRQMSVRYKIDGEWKEVMTLPKFAHAPLLSRIKIIAELNIAERRLPQTGYINHRHEKQDYRLKVEVLPTATGESVLIEVNKPRPYVKIEAEEITETDRVKLSQILEKNAGIVICFAPDMPDARKLMHPLLYEIYENDFVRNTILIEESNSGSLLPDVQVMFVNRKAGLTMESATRKVCRLNFDVVALDGIDIASAQTLMEATDKLIIIAMTATDIEDVINRFVYHFEIKPQLLAHRVKAVLGLVKNEVANAFDLSNQIKTMKTSVTFDLTDQIKSMKF